MFLFIFRGASYKKQSQIRTKSIFHELTYFPGMGGHTIGVLDVLVPLYHNFNNVKLLIALIFQQDFKEQMHFRQYLAGKLCLKLFFSPRKKHFDHLEGDSRQLTSLFSERLLKQNMKWFRIHGIGTKCYIRIFQLTSPSLLLFCVNSDIDAQDSYVCYKHRL